jgi:hypothetical protein
MGIKFEVDCTKPLGRILATAWADYFVCKASPQPPGPGPVEPDPDPDDPADPSEPPATTCDPASEVRPPHSSKPFPNPMPKGFASCHAFGAIWKPLTKVCENGALVTSGRRFICPDLGGGQKPNYSVGVWKSYPALANPSANLVGMLPYKTMFGSKHVWNWMAFESAFAARQAATGKVDLYVVAFRGKKPLMGCYVREWYCRED